MWPPRLPPSSSSPSSLPPREVTATLTTAGVTLEATASMALVERGERGDAVFVEGHGGGRGVDAAVADEQGGAEDEGSGDRSRCREFLCHADTN